MHINMWGIATLHAVQLEKPSALTCMEITSSFLPRHLDIYVVRSTSKAFLPLMELISFWLERKQQPLEMISKSEQIWNSPFSFVFALFVCDLNSSNKVTLFFPLTQHIILHNRHGMQIKHHFLIPTCRWLRDVMNTLRKSTWGGAIFYRKHIFDTAWMWKKES